MYIAEDISVYFLQNIWLGHPFPHFATHLFNFSVLFRFIELVYTVHRKK